MNHALPSHRFLIPNLLGQMAFGLIAMTLSIPSMQEWGAIFGEDQPTVQMTLSAYLLLFGTAQLIYGPLSDRYGRKRLLMLGLILAGVGSALAALAPSLPLLIAARALQGAGCAAGMVLGRAMVQDFFDGPERTRVMAYTGMAMGLCPPLGTIIGGQIHVSVGWQGNFVLAALLALVMLLAAWRGLPVHRKQPIKVDSHWLSEMLTAYRQLLRAPVFLGYIGVIGMSTAVFYVFLGGAPIVLGSYGVGPDGIGWYIAAIPLAYIVGNYATSHLIHRLGEPLTMTIGQGLALASIGLLLWLSFIGIHTPLAFTLPLMLLGIGHGFIMPPSLAGTVSVLPALAGAAAAVAGLLQQLMGAIGGLVVGLVPHDGTTNLGWMLLGFTLLAITMQLFLRHAHLTTALDADQAVESPEDA
ncbi:multidrug effflux MFS transporter [Sedimenticola sp.]|uniref:multidrug effflux MFS transporter n=1 Tax=Sedimenticola sp. TaxID=1940285 RepID=UPI0025875DB0|nr:multidrug effflux MFS transporter [Sedimenticola sp.]MCW8903051.1 multidrug effflux MFS transporter [Sedimenticola sp.]